MVRNNNMLDLLTFFLFVLTLKLQLFLCPHFETQNVYVNINRIMSVGNRLLESGHYASQQIQQISGQLEQEWKAFAAALDERSTLLEMSASFHQKADQVQSRHSNTHLVIAEGKTMGTFPLLARYFDAFVSLYVQNKSVHQQSTSVLHSLKDNFS